MFLIFSMGANGAGFVRQQDERYAVLDDDSSDSIKSVITVAVNVHERCAVPEHRLLQI